MLAVSIVSAGLGVVALAGSFVAGVLVGRRNRQKVELAVKEVNSKLGL